MIGTQFVVDLRQQVGAELSFVTLANGLTSTEVVINTTGELPGEYTLILESFDSSSSEGFTLKIDTITIIVTQANEAIEAEAEDDSYTLSYFVAELELKAIISGQTE